MSMNLRMNSTTPSFIFCLVLVRRLTDKCYPLLNLEELTAETVYHLIRVLIEPGGSLVHHVEAQSVRDLENSLRHSSSLPAYCPIVLRNLLTCSIAFPFLPS
ncbi:hypothetical protein ACB098_09G008700 [Castanea mollissima]